MYDQLLFGYHTGVNRDRIVASKEADYLLVWFTPLWPFQVPCSGRFSLKNIKHRNLGNNRIFVLSNIVN